MVAHCVMHGTITVLLVAFLFMSSRQVLRASAKNGKALTPPRGWNSYDSFSWLVTEDEFLDNAHYVAANLLRHGYEYVTVDFLWYRKNDTGATVSSGNDLIDEWGRLQPDPVRWPSSVGGNGFSNVAQQVHSMGLKFGIHVMRGISMAAVNSNTPVLDTNTGGASICNGGQLCRASDIAIPDDPCSWMPLSFVSVDTGSVGGRAFLHSVYQQYADWGVDYVKHDCVFGLTDLRLDEIATVSEIIGNLKRCIDYSLSPGDGSTTSMGESVSQLVQGYRVTTDTWDSWPNLLLHFESASEFASASLIGASNFQGGRSWPDLDMLPLGWITDPGSLQGPHRASQLTWDEQRSMVSLWALAKSPLIYGGDLRNIEQQTYDLITNTVMLDINANSMNNHELELGFNRTSTRVWIASGSSGKTFVGVWNLGSTSTAISVPINEVMSPLVENGIAAQWVCTGVDVWSNEGLVIQGSINLTLPSHSCSLYSLNCSS